MREGPLFDGWSWWTMMMSSKWGFDPLRMYSATPLTCLIKDIPIWMSSRRFIPEHHPNLCRKIQIYLKLEKAPVLKGELT